jgi:HAD superfamily hydrolase (TIGR01484 family)
MRYLALACDFDGTIAEHGTVSADTLDALTRVRTSGRKLLLVTGRQLDDLLRVFPRVDLFHGVVAENGALVYRPDTGEETVVASAPPPEFVEALEARGVAPLSVGRAIVATWEPNEGAVLEVIRDLGLELHVIFNKGAVMVLPSGVNKATGLAALLADLGLSKHDVVGVGDGENDHALLFECECGVAVANAAPMLKGHADWVTRAANGAGVAELIDELLRTDLAPLDARTSRHHAVLGLDAQGEPVTLPLVRHSILLAGASGSGKSTWATGIIERVAEHGYQLIVVDPEGDYDGFTAIPTIGDPAQPPSIAEVVKMLADPGRGVVVLASAVPFPDRPGFFAELAHELEATRARVGRPHVIVIDEAHHVLPAEPGPEQLPGRIEGSLYITVDPKRLSPQTLATVDVVLAVGETAHRVIADVARAQGLAAPEVTGRPPEPGEGLCWRPGEAVRRVRIVPGKTERLRHRRKYAAGSLGSDKSFYFRGPDAKLHLRAQNLTIFSQMLEGVDEATFVHHLRANDYSRWIREAIKDPELAEEINQVENDTTAPPPVASKRILDAIGKRYTAPG